MPEPMRVEDLRVYQKPCALHLDVCALGKSWPREERFELASQVRRSSNSAPANLAEKHSGRHIRNKIEGVNRARGEALETVHHLHIARLKGLVDEQASKTFRNRHLECIRMLNGLEKTLEKNLPLSSHRFPEREESAATNPEPQTLNPEP